jgi:uncharacterized protein (DUF362 family)
MMAAGIAKLGGWKAFVKAGKKATIKANVAWASRPDQAGNTNPLVASECVRACNAAGASQVVLPEKTCSPAKKSFSISGVEKAVTDAGGRLYSLKNSDFKDMDIPDGKKLTSASIAKDVIDTGCLINIPVAKSHSASVLTVSMKNWMGSVKSRKIWHLKGIDQCIADLSTLVKPNLIIIDATRIMTTDGPRGPGNVIKTNQIIFGTDPVACDAYAATLFDKKPFDVPHIKIAHEMKVGCGDLKQIEVIELKV